MQVLPKCATSLLFCFPSLRRSPFSPPTPCAPAYRPLSPLMQVYWLRLIIDEGHVMGNKQSNQANLAANLLCERKWACTGTPTPGKHPAPSLPFRSPLTSVYR